MKAYNMHKIFHSKIFTIFAVILAGLTLSALVKEVSNTFKVQKEIDKLEKHAEELEQKNNELKQVVEYLNSPAYQERAARENLNLKKQGEIAVALPSSNTLTEPEDQTNKDQQKPSNLRLWWNYFFGVK